MPLVSRALSWFEHLHCGARRCAAKVSARKSTDSVFLREIDNKGGVCIPIDVLEYLKRRTTASVIAQPASA